MCRWDSLRPTLSWGFHIHPLCVGCLCQAKPYPTLTDRQPTTVAELLLTPVHKRGGATQFFHTSPHSPALLHSPSAAELARPPSYESHRLARSQSGVILSPSQQQLLASQARQSLSPVPVPVSPAARLGTARSQVSTTSSGSGRRVATIGGGDLTVPAQLASPLTAEALTRVPGSQNSPSTRGHDDNGTPSLSLLFFVLVSGGCLTSGLSVSCPVSIYSSASQVPRSTYSSSSADSRQSTASRHVIHHHHVYVHGDPSNVNLDAVLPGLQRNAETQVHVHTLSGSRVGSALSSASSQRRHSKGHLQSSPTLATLAEEESRHTKPLK